MTVDAAGIVTGPGARWSLDWWVGADDEWRFPSRVATVRQRQLGAGAVVETAMRVPGGDALHRVWAGPRAAVIEVENASPAPFALAWAIRPYGRGGCPAPIRSIEVAKEAVVVDRRIAIRLPSPARHLALSGDGGDVASVVTGGAAPAASTGDCRSRERLATAALVVPVTHRTVTRLVVPLLDATKHELPEREAVLRGWATILSGGFRVTLPEQALDDALATGRRRLLVDEDDADGRRVIEEVAGRCATVSAGTVTLLPDMAASWIGQNLDVHELPLGGGMLSFAVRWHGTRPALLWERSGPALRLRAPSLDPAWSTDEPRGEALLASHPDVGTTGETVQIQ